MARAEQISEKQQSGQTEELHQPHPDIARQIEDSRLSGMLDFFAVRNLCSPKAYPRLKTGFEQLDQLLGGGIAPGVVVLGAISNLGKSTWALQMAQHVAKEGTPVIYVSLEMSRIQIAAKSISRQIFIDSGCDRSQGVEADQLLNHNYMRGLAPERRRQLQTQIERAREQVERETKHLHIVVNPLVARSAQTICEFVGEFIAGTGQKPLVIVDYLQILSGESRRYGADSRQTVEESIRRLSGLASEENVPVLVISSLNRSSYGMPVRFEAFKESGCIEYSADVVLGMQLSAVNRAGKKRESFDLEKEKSKSPRELEIVVLKQRYGKSGANARVAFDYYMEYDYFKEREAAEKSSRTEQGEDSRREDVGKEFFETYAHLPVKERL